MGKRIEKLYIFNLATDLDDPLLAFTHDWINSSLREANNIEIVSTHVGRVDLPPQVKVREIGGGSLVKRIVGIIRMFRILLEILLSPKDIVVFYHMSNKSAALIGFPLRLAGVPQGLWYSHSASPISFKLAAKFVDFVFSSSPHALPMSGRKCKYVGHGINFSNYGDIPKKRDLSERTFISLGRISPIKNLESFIRAVATSRAQEKIIYLAGPAGLDLEYQKKLLDVAAAEKVSVVFLGEILYSDVPKLLENYSICYTGNPRTTDKAAIEAAAAGCFVICMEPNTQELTGMNLLWDSLQNRPSDLTEQINAIIDLENSYQYRKRISRRAKEQSDVQKTVTRILANINRA